LALGFSQVMCKGMQNLLLKVHGFKDLKVKKFNLLVQKLESFGGEKDGSRISERNVLNGVSLRGMNHTVHTEERSDEAISII
jgi:hypothetical protein